MKSKKINNPFNDIEGYNCFGCASKNKFGLQLTFREEGDFLISEWIPKQHFAGYMNTLHGGIQATLLDEIASWIIQIKLNIAGVTSGMQLKYKKAVYTTDTKLIIKANILEKRRNLVTVHTELLNSDEEICCIAKVTYFTFSKEESVKNYLLPKNHQKFYK